MRKFLMGAVIGAAAAAATSAMAAQTPNAAAAGRDAHATAGAARVLYLCDQTAATRRGFAREFGAAAFVTAEEASRASGAWSAPKCISRVELNRLRATKDRLAAR